MPSPEVVFAGSRRDKRLYAGVLAAFALLAFTALTDPSISVRIAGSTAGVVLLASAWRARRWGRIEVFRDHVAVRSLWRARRFRWGDVQRFVVQERPVIGGYLPAWHRTLGVTLTSGRTVWAAPANASSREPVPTWVDRAAAELNDRLRHRRGCG